ncbi:tetrapyrrole-binding protein, chloroplastic [Amborella trichopoda]|nr:tetrapyrrole-binding protein, chloroplastic [Amborella trichopoda]|eukprot:XP_006852129.2 tetrapyrrole-binding protein, chloroplastic [Amborella trichopoda]
MAAPHQPHLQTHTRHHLFPSKDSLSETTATTTTPPPYFLSLKTTSPRCSPTITFATNPTTTMNSSLSLSTNQQTISYDLLEEHLSNKQFREADEETRRLLIQLAGEQAQTRKYVFFSEVKFIGASDLQAIDKLWSTHSNGKFGYSVQKKIWEKVERDFTKFFVKVGWMKKLETEVEQFGYRSFPTEFMWELNGETPEGHLPLTNALRGTQLLYSILTHPAFEVEEEQEEEVDVKTEDVREENLKSPNKPLIKRSLIEPDYSF